MDGQANNITTVADRWTRAGNFNGNCPAPTRAVSNCSRFSDRWVEDDGSYPRIRDLIDRLHNPRKALRGIAASINVFKLFEAPHLSPNTG